MLAGLTALGVIATLEGRLGVRLLDRDTHTCWITVDGGRFLREARTALAAVDRAVAAVTGPLTPAPSLTLALKADSDAGLLSEILRHFAAAGGRPAVEFVFRETHELLGVVQRGIADVALLVTSSSRLAEISDGVEVEPVWREGRVAVLATGHQLAARGDLTVTDFADQPVISWPTLPAFYDRYYRGADGLPLGAPPPSGPPAASLAEALRLVELGRGITFLPISVAARFRRAALALQLVPGLSDSTAYLGWRTGSRDQTIAALTRATIAAASTRSA